MSNSQEVASQAFLLVMQLNGSEASASIAHTPLALPKLSVVLLQLPVLPIVLHPFTKTQFPTFWLG